MQKKITKKKIIVKDKKNSVGERAILLHKKLQGKISITPKAILKNFADLSLYYTPGVGAVSSFVAKHKDKTNEYTGRGNMVAVVSDGSAVLGLGNIGPEGALPVMEGKAMIFKSLAGIDAMPIVLSTQNTDEIVAAVKAIAPSFGGINLEDIAAPRCFEIEARLKRELTIPVMHDDQHGTAIVVLAGLINAFKVVKKNIHKGKVVIVGAGAAGHAIADLLLLYGIGELLVVDRKGIIGLHRDDLDSHKHMLATLTNPKKKKGDVATALTGADAVIGVSGPGIIDPSFISLMDKMPIVFALANPIPEIMPEEARRAGAYVIATGRSDFPNQINNSLVFPALFRAMLDKKIPQFKNELFVKVAIALAQVVENKNTENIIPSMFDKKVYEAVYNAVS